MGTGKSGQQQSEENIASFRAWVASKRDEDFIQYVYRGQISRTEIAKECEFGKSAITQNPTIKMELAQLENILREKQILPPLINTENTNSETGSAASKFVDERVKRLESENSMLRAEVDNFRKYIKRYDAVERFMSETMRMPR